MQSALSLAQARLSVSTIEQFAAAYMLKELPHNYADKYRKIYEGRRNALLGALKSIPDIKIANPQGAFYAVAELPVENAEEFSIYMLENFSLDNTTTFLAPAEGFYLESNRGNSEVRIAYVLAEDDLVKAVKNIGAALEQYKKAKK
jgi:aspartate aminotransferase